MLFITIMTKCLIQRKRSTKYDKNSPKLKQGATGTSTGRRMPRSHRSPGSAERTTSRRQELSSSSVAKRKKYRRGKSEYTTVLNKYNTNYEAPRMADSTALAFKPWQNFIKAIYYELMNYHKPSYIVINQN